MYKEAEKKMFYYVSGVFGTDHPAMLLWADIEYELKDLRAKVAKQNTANNSENTPCRNCGSTAGTYSMGEQCLSCHCEA